MASKLKGKTLDIRTAPVFEPLLQPARYKGAHGGRGSGKSHFFAESAVEHALTHPGFRLVCVREVQKSLRESVKLLIEDKIELFGASRKFQVRDQFIRTPRDGMILFQGMQDHTAESAKSLEGFWAYIEEAQTMTKRSLEILRPTIRSEGSEIWSSWNPRSANDPIDLLLRGETPPADSIVVEANWDDNPFFPAVLEEERLYDKEFNPSRYQHIWEGAYEPIAIGAIWDRVTIHQHRVAEAPALSRVLIGIDPAISSEEQSNETGIVAAGLGEDMRGYVLDDVSIVDTPKGWATRAIAAYDLYDADAIVVEINQGGEMVKHTIRSVRPDVRVIEVRATRGKHVRAEPISAMYHTGKVSHVGTHAQLEDQMVQMTASGYEGEGSPDRVDALVWVLSELFPKMTRRALPAALPKTSNHIYNPHRWQR